MVHADLDVRLVRLDERGGEVEQREDVLRREVLDRLDDGLEAAVARVLRAREVVEERGKLAEEAVGVQPIYRWLVTPARSGSSDGGSYQDRA